MSGTWTRFRKLKGSNFSSKEICIPRQLFNWCKNHIDIVRSFHCTWSQFCQNACTSNCNLNSDKLCSVVSDNQDMSLAIDSGVLLYFSYSSTDSLFSPILVSDWLIFWGRKLIVHQKRNENDKNIILFDEKQQQNAKKVYVKIK